MSAIPYAKPDSKDEWKANNEHAEGILRERLDELTPTALVGALVVARWLDESVPYAGLKGPGRTLRAIASENGGAK